MYLAVFTGGCCLGVFGCVYWYVLFECIWLCLLVVVVGVYLAVFTVGCCWSVFGCVGGQLLFRFCYIVFSCLHQVFA